MVELKYWFLLNVKLKLWDIFEFCLYVNIKYMISIKYEYVISIVIKCWIYIYFFIYFWFEVNCKKIFK